jgi:hypothetical protein
MNLPPIETHDGRRAWAFIAIWGGCVTFTIFAAVTVWLVAGNALYSFYLGLAAHVQVLVGMTALGWAMGRRVRAEVGKDGAKIDDSGAADV